MLRILIFLILIVLIVVFSATNPENKKRQYSTKDLTRQYLSGFRMYLCLKNKLILYPPKEMLINNKYHTINLATKSNLFPHKSINAGGISDSSSICTECLNHCSLKSDDIVDLKISFSEFKLLTNEDFKAHLHTVLTEEQYKKLFS